VQVTLDQPDWNWVLLNDADSFCLSPELPEYLYREPDTFWCNVLCHENEHQADDQQDHSGERQPERLNDAKPRLHEIAVRGVANEVHAA